MVRDSCIMRLWCLGSWVFAGLILYHSIPQKIEVALKENNTRRTILEHIRIKNGIRKHILRVGRKFKECGLAPISGRLQIWL